MQENIEKERQAVIAWVMGPGSSIVLGLLAALVIAFVLAIAGV